MPRGKIALVGIVHVALPALGAVTYLMAFYAIEYLMTFFWR
jgi:hypothetical protein